MLPKLRKYPGHEQAAVAPSTVRGVGAVVVVRPCKRVVDAMRRHIVVLAQVDVVVHLQKVSSHFQKTGELLVPFTVCERVNDVLKRLQ